MTTIRFNSERVLRMASVAGCLICSVALATPPDHGPDSLSLRSNNLFGFSTTGAGLIQPADSSASDIPDRTLDGPYFLRSADPVPPGVMELKYFYGFTVQESGDEHEFEFVIEWGMMEDLEFILEIPVVLGDGRDVEGNGDIKAFGFHIRHWKENGLLPAFATRQLIRIPTGDDSDGVDYLGRGLFTWTVVPDTVRLHFNPFLRSVNGNDDEHIRSFQWGAAVGFDCHPNDQWTFIVDYFNQTSDAYGGRNQQTIEIGGDWEFTPGHTLAFGTEFEIDGDSQGDDFTARFGYIMDIKAPTIGG